MLLVVMHNLFFSKKKNLSQRIFLNNGKVTVSKRAYSTSNPTFKSQVEREPVYKKGTTLNNATCQKQSSHLSVNYSASVLFTMQANHTRFH